MKEKISGNPSHNILELYNVAVEVRVPQVRQDLISSMMNLVYELQRELPNDLRLR